MTNTKEWVILFGGVGRESCIGRIFSEGLKVKAIVVPKKRNEKLESVVLSLKSFPCSLIEVGKNELESALIGFVGKALLSIGFPYLIPNTLLSVFSPAINIHPTLLPRYRGPTTGAYVLINGEKESGSTVHFMEKEMDRGHVISQSKVPITPFDTVRSLQRKVYAAEPQLLIEALQLLESGFTGEPQDETKATEFPKKRTPADSEVDPNRPLVDLFNQIRACDPEDYPAYFWHDGEKVFIKLWRRNKPSSESDLI